MKNLRTHGKSTIVWLLMGLLVLGLGGFGVTSFSGGSTEIGSVGETKVTADDYTRALRNQINAYARQAGRPLSMAEAQSIGVPQAVQAQLFTGAALEEQARRIGVSVGDERVRQSILAAEAFRGPNGNFDRTAYAEVLRRERMSEAEFERAIRGDEARLLIQDAVSGGVVAPDGMVRQTAAWLLETRDMAWRELTENDLPAAIADPDDAALEGWHKANADRFTAPEIRRISYVWLTPEMLADEVQLDEDALRNVYDQNIAEYQQPERRMVSRLVFPSAEEAEAAMADIDAGELPFEAFVLQRGLTLDDVYLGELSEAQLGGAGEAVFALDQPGVVGPIATDLGPALFSMNAILEPVEISFEEAQEALRTEAAADRAARMIEDRSAEFEDLLAGGATLEQLAEETPMQLGQIDWSAGTPAPERSIAGYEAFRELAATLADSDFPTLHQLDDGGVFAARLDEVVPPALIDFDEVRDDVAADWRQAEVHRQLVALAEERRLELNAAAAGGVAPAPAPTSAADTPARVAMPDPAPAPDNTDPEDAAAEDTTPDSVTPGNVTPEDATAGNETAENEMAGPGADDGWTTETGLRRDGWIEATPGDLVQHAFVMAEPGEVDLLDAESRVFLVRLDAVHAADLTTEEALRVIDAVGNRLAQSLQGDLFDYYARAAQISGGLQLNQSAINAVNAQVQ